MQLLSPQSAGGGGGGGGGKTPVLASADKFSVKGSAAASASSPRHDALTASSTADLYAPTNLQRLLAALHPPFPQIGSTSPVANANVTTQSLSPSLSPSPSPRKSSSSPLPSSIARTPITTATALIIAPSTAASHRKMKMNAASLTLSSPAPRDSIAAAAAAARDASGTDDANHASTSSRTDQASLATDDHPYDVTNGHYAFGTADGDQASRAANNATRTTDDQTDAASVSAPSVDSLRPCSIGELALIRRAAVQRAQLRRRLLVPQVRLGVAVVREREREMRGRYHHLCFPPMSGIYFQIMFVFPPTAWILFYHVLQDEILGTHSLIRFDIICAYFDPFDICRNRLFYLRPD